ncbi:hypothetical protein ABE096_21610 [Robertmurraya massiliosenegalensis]|uniref:hypothetical protein n=1 Tax=Robertmurraya TaxID=2837507 RepID=UPI0039A42E9E
MLSFRAVFRNHKINNEKCNNEFYEVDLTWYDDPSDDPYEFEFPIEEDNAYVAWTEHLIRYHDWLLKYYSDGYSLLFMSIIIYRDHDQTQDDILFSMTNYPENYNSFIKLIRESLENYAEASKGDLEFIHYVEQRSPLFNRIINCNRSLSTFIANNVFNDNEITQFNSVITTITKLPYLLYQANIGEIEKIFNSSISLLKGYLKFFNGHDSNNNIRAKDSLILLINELKSIISYSDELPFK